MIKIDGKAIANSILSDIDAYTGDNKLKIGVLYAGNDNSILSYIKSKKRISEKINIELKIIHKPNNISENEFIDTIIELNKDNSINGIIIEKPLPEHIDIKRISEIIDYKKDIDCINPLNNGKLIMDKFVIAPSTAMAVINILDYMNIDVNGKRITILGRSEIVGKPLALLLISKSINKNATISICHSKTKNITFYTQNSDIIIASIGKANYVDKTFIGNNKPILIDVGINYVNNKITGDISKELYELSSMFTPVPGGVGPVTVATLFQNTVKLHKLYG